MLARSIPTTFSAVSSHGDRCTSRSYPGIRVLAVRRRGQQDAGTPEHGRDLLGHVYGPDAGAGAEIQDARLGVRGQGGNVEVLVAGDEEELVEDVHTVLLLLRGRREQKRRGRARLPTSSQGYMYMPFM